MSIELTILSSLIYNEEYARKVLPYLKEEYFESADDLCLFKLISAYIDKYNDFPTKEALFVDLENTTGINESTYANVQHKIDLLKPQNTNLDWLKDTTEAFCRERAIYNCIRESLSILDGKSKLSRDAIPDLMKDALAISFDSHVGHDYFSDWEDRYDEYHKPQVRVPFDIKTLNKVTKGGFPKKTFNLWVAGTHVGKTLIMSHCASAAALMGYKVLYISMEMGEIGDPSISQRIDANLLNVALDELMLLPKDVYKKKVESVLQRTNGQIIIKEFPTASAGANHFRYLLNELKLKRNFTPDIIFVDYLNICISSRIKHGSNVNSYTYIMSIAQELRGLAAEFNVPVVSATQLNRASYSSSDPGLDDVADSFGISFTADFVCAATQDEMLAEMNQYVFHQLKNRYSNIDMLRSFVVGVDKRHMRLFDLDQSAQEKLVKNRIEEKDVSVITNKKVDKSKFKGFK